jgi:hypothetical protein
MFTKFLKSAALAAACLFSANSFAGLITDVENVNTKLSMFQSVSWTHNILDQGFDLGSAESATLTIEFRDDKDPWYAPFETALIKIGLFDLQDGGVVLNPTVDWSGALGLTSLIKLNADGTLLVKVTSTLGDFLINKSTLDVVTKDVVVDVPESNTLVLLGLGLLGLMIMRRKARA